MGITSSLLRQAAKQPKTAGSLIGSAFKIAMSTPGLIGGGAIAGAITADSESNNPTQQFNSALSGAMLGALKGGTLAGGLKLMKSGLRGPTIKSGIIKTGMGAGIFAGGVYSIASKDTPDDRYTQYQRAVKRGTSNGNFQNSTVGLVQGLNGRRHG